VNDRQRSLGWSPILWGPVLLVHEARQGAVEKLLSLVGATWLARDTAPAVVEIVLPTAC
jgi:hypothetical protein